jgi:hypothetical protein
MIQETALTARQVFDVDEFDVAVTGADDSLFDVPANKAAEIVQVTLRGTVLTRIGGGQ